ncbi:MAG: endonuclease/exonuclease/phosphatase family protein [Kiritimatiellae bacterium]|nr:endonuclease/exonuclease/phosphatase family protein [Kiritimatiellia bacterium]MDW8458592.1 endonuclease/exonuclease/phosphatase family protein [Verrucomicrobiota bacterium]
MKAAARIVTISLRTVRRFLFPLASCAWLAGWILNEQPPPWLWLYFIPAPLIAAWGLLEILIHIRRASIHRKLFLIAMTGAAMVRTAVIDARWNRPQKPPDDALRIVHWNIARAHAGIVPVLQTIAPYRPDVVMLSEARNVIDLPFYSKRELGLPFARSGDGMALLSRYSFFTLPSVPIENGWAWAVRLQTPQGELDVVCADIVSHPLIDRTASLAPLAKWLEERKDPTPLVLMGDFNTPRDARAFRPFRRHLVHAFESAGQGWPYTWPLPIPLYSIDHAWISTNIVIHRYRLRDSPLSDHRRQLFEISLDAKSASVRE